MEVLVLDAGEPPRAALLGRRRAVVVKKKPRRAARSKPEPRPAPPPPLTPWGRAWAWIFEPQPVERLELLRIVLPLAILGFLSQRLAHAPYWLGTRGLVIPNLGHPDYRQPLYLAPLAPWQAWAAAALIIAGGLATSLGAFTRVANAVFAFLLAYAALANRLEAFTVSKLGAALAIALFLSPCGSRYSVDAWRARRRNDKPKKPRTHVAGGSVRFVQVTLLALYAGSGIAKSRGDWLHDPLVIWSHLHDSYQSGFAYFLARHIPSAGWTLFQGMTLAYELFAPLWYSVRKTRVLAIVFGVGMHGMIALLFPPVMWFSFLMIALIFAGFAPEAWLISPEARAASDAAPLAGAGPKPGVGG
jgi:uncharacterized membrane protein YphA (DoxX/SURF4 family)